MVIILRTLRWKQLQTRKRSPSCSEIVHLASSQLSHFPARLCIYSDCCRPPPQPLLPAAPGCSDCSPDSSPRAPSPTPGSGTPPDPRCQARASRGEWREASSRLWSRPSVPSGHVFAQSALPLAAPPQRGAASFAQASGQGAR